MRQARQQRLISLHANKQNQLNNNSLVTNLPALQSRPHANNAKLSLKGEFQLNLHQRKKTYLNLCTKRDGKASREGRKDVLETARNGYEQTLTTQMSGVYLSSRTDKNNYRSTGRTAGEKSHVLDRHQITTKMRAKMIDWLLQISQAYKCKTQTLFLSIHLMDQYFSLSPRPLPLSQLHLIGVTCIYMACKYEQIHAIRMKTVVRDIAHGKITAREIVAKEADILITIGFQFQRKCLYMGCMEIVGQICQYMQSGQYQLLKNNIQYFCKLIAFDCDILRKQDPILLSKAVLLASIRSMPEPTKNLQLYDGFISSCGSQDYESSHHICSRILFLHVNIKSEYGKLENIQRMCPFGGKATINSCQL